MSDASEMSELMATEDRLWTELHALVDSLLKDEAAGPGYFAEGWSAKDLIAHLGSWSAADGAALERMQAGTYRFQEFDIDALNRRFYDAMKYVSFETVRAQATASRNRRLGAWGSLPADTPDADMWVRKSGPDHYGQHLPRLREWVAAITS